MFIGSLLKWRFDVSGVSNDLHGIFGILTLLFGLLIAAVAGIRTFGAGVELPDSILGMSLEKIAAILSVSIFIPAFGLIAGQSVKFGVHLTWIGAAIATAGAVLAIRNEGAGTPATTI